MIEFKQLRFFVAIAESSSFSKAAEKLYISQPALSQQMSKLEEQIGVTLINRSTRSVQLTPAGRNLYERAIPLMTQMENMMQSVKASEFSLPQHQRLRMAVEDGMFSLEYTGAFQFIQQLRDMEPELSLDCFPAAVGSMTRQLSDGSADIGIAYIAGASSLSPNLVERCIYRGPLALAVPRSWTHEMGTPEFADAVNRTTLYYPLERTDWHGIMNGFFAKYNYYPHVVSLQNYNTVINYLVAGGGICFAPEEQLRHWPQEYIRIIPIEDPLAEYRVSVFYRANIHSIAIQRVLELLPEEAPPSEQTARD